MAEDSGNFEFDRDALKIYIERIEAVAVEKDSLSDDIKAIYDDAKDDGFSTKVMRRVVSDRKKDRTAIQGERSLYDAYNAALGPFADTDLGKAAVTKAAPKTMANKAKAEAAGDGAKPKPAGRPAAGAGAPSAAKRSDGEALDQKEIGRRAALAEKSREDNPCEAGSIDAQMWDAGYGLGNQERVNQQALADGAAHRRGAGVQEPATTVN